jgi:hypothetical protein
MTLEKIFIIALVWASLLPSMLLADTGEEGYGCATWGMSLGQVKECLDSAKCRMVSTNPAVLMCDDTVAGEAAFSGYRFSNDSLYQVKILFRIEAVKHQTYLEKHAKVEESLEKRYGEAQKKYRKTRVNPFENDAQQIASGRGYYQTLWKTQETEILLTLKGENNKLVLSLQYSSVAYLKQKAGENR